MVECIRSKLLEGGGVDVTEYGPDCTHLILDRTVYDDPICVAARRDGKVLVTNLWVEHSFDVGMVVDHLSNLAGRGCREASGGTVTDPNKAMVHINSHLSRKEKAKVQKAEKNNKIDTEDENLSLDSTRNSFSQALQDRRFGSGSLLKKPDRRKSSSLDLNNVVINICHSSSPHFGVMKKTPITTSRVGTFPSPRTPHYHHSIVGIQKGCHCIQLLIGGRAVNGGNLLANSSFSIGVMTNDGLSIQCGGNLGSGNFHVLTQLHGKVCYMYLMGFAFFAGANFLLTLVAAFLTVYFAPTTSGPRVSKINAYINGVDTPIMLGATTLFVKIIGSIGAISTGIDLGKGEPLIYFGNCIASLLGQGGSDNYKLSWHWLRYVNNDMDKRDLIT
ncbi:hypothetical protein P3L10_015451 [Capsicum annuum]